MATYLPRDPTLEERIVGAHLIVIGRITGVREVRPAEGFDRPRVFGLFDVEAADVLYGAAPDRLLVRILSDPDDRDPDLTGKRTQWSVPVNPEAPVLFLLVRDVAPELPDDVYAVYLASAFAVQEDEWVTVPPEAVDESAHQVADADNDGRVRIDGLRRLIEMVTTQRDNRLREFGALLPPTLRDVPYPSSLERPDAEFPAPPPRLREAVPVSDGGQPANEQTEEGSSSG